MTNQLNTHWISSLSGEQPGGGQGRASRGMSLMLLGGCPGGVTAWDGVRGRAGQRGVQPRQLSEGNGGKMLELGSYSPTSPLRRGEAGAVAVFLMASWTLNPASTC